MNQREEFYRAGHEVVPVRNHMQHPSAEVDKSAIIFPGVYIGPKVVIGKDCVIGPNTCIGQPGFGYERLDNGELLYRTHTEGVIIDDDVHIGANTCIDQGRHRPTRIGSGTRIDNLVHIAHNVIVGRFCLIIAHSMIGGSCLIGDYCHLAPAAVLCDHVTVGGMAVVGLGAVVRHDIPSGETWVGNPARKLR